jgi:hypothetical protein
MKEPSLVFTGLWFGFIRLPSEKYKIILWKKKEFEDLKDLLSFRLYFVIAGDSLCLWLTDIAHHHLAIAFIFLIAGHHLFVVQKRGISSHSSFVRTFRGKFFGLDRTFSSCCYSRI